MSLFNRSVHKTVYTAKEMSKLFFVRKGTTIIKEKEKSSKGDNANSHRKTHLLCWDE